MAGVGFGTAEVVFGGKGEDWLTEKLWQDPAFASGSLGCASAYQH